MKIGKFDVIELLGRGAMGMVYRAHDPYLNRYVAIKVMTAHLDLDSELRARFLREAQAAGSLQHPNITTIFELGDAEGRPYIAMEYVPGRDLDDLIDSREALSLIEKIDIIEQVCRGLAYAHDHGVIHRDIKPANIRINESGQAKIMDFGVAHLVSSRLTQTGALMGTPSYMAPEVIEGRGVDGRADIFSVGATLYELLAYEKPFEGESLQSLFHKILNSQPPSLRERGIDVPPLLDRIVTRALAKDPAERYGSMGELLVDLLRFWETVPGAARERETATATLAATARRTGRRRAARRSVWIGIVAALLLLATSAVVWTTLGPPSDAGSASAPGEVERATAEADEGRGPETESPGERIRSVEERPGERLESPETRIRQGAAGAQPGAVEETEPARPPDLDRAADERAYRSARRRADEARRAALDAGATEFDLGSFRRADSLHHVATEAAEAGRYDRALTALDLARLGYTDAGREAMRHREVRIDSAWAAVSSLRATLDTVADADAEALGEARLWEERAREAERVGEDDRVMDYLARVERAYERARAGAPPRQAAAADSPDEAAAREAPGDVPSAEGIVERTLASLRSAIESEDLPALRETWVGLTSEQRQNFRNAFELMSDLQVSFEIRRIDRTDGHIHVTVETTYDFFNESSRRRDRQRFRQELEIVERDGRWVVVGSRGGN